MKSRAYFRYKASGNLAVVVSGGVYVGSVAVNEYFLMMDKDNLTEENWLSTDMVFIIFERPDGRKGSPQLMTYNTDGYWHITTNGWETDVDIGNTVSSLKVSFTMRRYTRLSAGSFVETRPTEIVTIPLYPSGEFTQLELDGSASEAILAAVEDVQSDIGDVNPILAAIVNGTPFEVVNSGLLLIDNTSTTESGKGALDARQGSLLMSAIDEKADGADIEALQQQIDEKADGATVMELEKKVDSLQGGSEDTSSPGLLFQKEVDMFNASDGFYSQAVDMLLNGEERAKLADCKILFFRYILRDIFANYGESTTAFRNNGHFESTGIIVNNAFASGPIKNATGELAMIKNFQLIRCLPGSLSSSDAFYVEEVGRVIVKQNEDSSFTVRVRTENSLFVQSIKQTKAHIEFYGIS